MDYLHAAMKKQRWSKAVLNYKQIVMPHYTAPRTLSRKIEDYLDYGFTSNSSSAATATSTAYDGFGRLRVAEPYTLFDSQHRYSENKKWNNVLTGTGAVAYIQSESAVDLKAPAGAGTVTRQSNVVFPYQPGKSLLLMNSFAFSARTTTGSQTVTQRIGYFSSDNGIYLEQTNGTADVVTPRNGNGLRFVLRSDSTNTTVGDSTEISVEQANWNGDKFDGTGISGRILDISKANIFWMDIEWLGVGDVRCGFIVDGRMVVAHTFHNDNINTTSYMTTAVLPIRYELTNTGTTSPYVKQICNTVISEGGFNPTSITYNQLATANISNANLRTAATDGLFYNVVSIRLATGKTDGIIIPTDIELLGESNKSYQWALLRNATFGTAPTWTTHADCDTAQFTTSVSTITGGVLVKTGYFTSNSGSVGATLAGDIALQLGRTIAGVSDTYTVAITTTGTNAKYTGGLAWYQII